MREMFPLRPRSVTPPGGGIVYTSGTTGSYKKILRPGIHDAEASAKYGRMRGFGADTVYHGGGFGLWTSSGYAQPRAVWLTGGCMILDRRPDVLDNLFRHAITHVTLLPPDLKHILATRNPAEPRRPGLTILCGGGFLPLVTAEGIRSRLTDDLRLVYGATECITLMSSQYREFDDLFWMTPFEGRVAQIVDLDGNEVPEGQDGELRFQLIDIDASSYLDDDETSARVFRDGYFYPGDLAVKRADGRIRVLGRVADVLNLQGQKIAVAPIEQAVQQRLQVEDVCLFSELSGVGRENLVIALQSTRHLPQAALDAIAAEFPTFDSVRFVQLAAFPRTAAGMRKVDRLELRRRLLGSNGK